MAKENAAAYDCLPAYIDVFRGQDLDKPLGLAWTLDEGVALYDFAMNLFGDHLAPRRRVCARAENGNSCGVSPGPSNQRERTV